MKVCLCDACGAETPERDLKKLHTHGPMNYTISSTGLSYPYPTPPTGYDSWEVCASCYAKAIESIGWYREYHAKRAAEKAAEVKS